MHLCLPHFWRAFAPIALACFAIPSAGHAQTPQKPSPTVPPILLASAKPVESISVESIEHTPCGDPSRRFGHAIAVADFAGANVKTIRVLRYSSHFGKLDPKEVQRILRQVWDSSFDDAECGILWSEGTFWSIEASLEFEDGKTGRLVTDGIHVALINHDSKSWFFRISPPHAM